MICFSSSTTLNPLLSRTFSLFSSPSTRHFCTLISPITSLSHVLPDSDSSKQDPQRPTMDDVLRISRGQGAKRRGTGSRAIPHRLNAEERRSYESAMRDGFVTLGSNLGHRRERKGSPLFNLWRMHCDARANPAIMLVKRGARRTMDEIWIDISTLRGCGGHIGDIVQQLNDITELKGMVETESTVVQCEKYDSNNNGAFVPTWRIPEIWIKYQLEDRSLAKQMARNIAKQLGCPSEQIEKKKMQTLMRKELRKEARRSYDEDKNDFDIERK